MAEVERMTSGESAPDDGWLSSAQVQSMMCECLACVEQKRRISQKRHCYEVYLSISLASRQQRIKENTCLSCLEEWQHSYC